MTDGGPAPDTDPYRPCVGIVLTNAQGLIFAGQRAETSLPAWQMPQGGIDAGETVDAAAYRELAEETGVARGDVTWIAQTQDWLRYDLPPEIAAKRWKGRFKGQKQMWVHLRLTAPDTVIDLTAHDVEFSEWRWMTGADLLEAIVPFKASIYKQVLAEFGLC